MFPAFQPMIPNACILITVVMWQKSWQLRADGRTSTECFGQGDPYTYCDIFDVQGPKGSCMCSKFGNAIKFCRHPAWYAIWICQEQFKSFFHNVVRQGDIWYNASYRFCEYPQKRKPLICGPTFVSSISNICVSTVVPVPILMVIVTVTPWRQQMVEPLPVHCVIILMCKYQRVLCMFLLQTCAIPSTFSSMQFCMWYSWILLEWGQIISW